MATQGSTRIREAAEPDGTIGVRAGARKYARYGVTLSLVQGWIRRGDVEVAKAAAFPGDTVLLNEASLRKRISAYSPHRDNASRRRRRSKTIPEMQAEANGNGDHAVSNGHAPGAGLGVPHTLRPASSRRNAAAATAETQPLITRDWIDKFYADQTRRIGVSRNGEPKVLNHKTKHNYDWAFGRFMARFPTVPLEAGDGVPRARRQVLDYVEGLTDARTGKPMEKQTKLGYLRIIAGFYNWLKREYGYHVPDLTASGMKKSRGKLAVPMFPDDTRAVLKHGVRNHAEKTIILLLAQTGARLSELCTIRPELLKDHWVYVWGKKTAANPTGRRPLAIPDEAYKELITHFKVYRELAWVDLHGRAKALAGPVEAAGPWAIDMRDDETYMVQPLPGMVDSMGTNIRRMVRDAGVYTPGKTAHSFRRAYQAEFIQNGGSPTFMRLVMGHFEVGDMDDLYTHAKIEDIVEQARRYAPRSFLHEAADQAALPLNGLAAAALDMDDDEDC